MPVVKLLPANAGDAKNTGYLLLPTSKLYKKLMPKPPKETQPNPTSKIIYSGVPMVQAVKKKKLTLNNLQLKFIVWCRVAWIQNPRKKEWTLSLITKQKS